MLNLLANGVTFPCSVSNPGRFLLDVDAEYTIFCWLTSLSLVYQCSVPEAAGLR